MNSEDYCVPVHAEIELYSKRTEFLLGQMHHMYRDSQAHGLSVEETRQLVVILEKIDVLISRPDCSLVSVVATLKSVYTNDLRNRENKSPGNDL
jgi:hypothetical protein